MKRATLPFALLSVCAAGLPVSGSTRLTAVHTTQDQSESKAQGTALPAGPKSSPSLPNTYPAPPPRPAAEALTGPAVGYVYVNGEGSVSGFAVDAAGNLMAVPGSPYTTVAGTSNCDVMTAIYEQNRRVLYVSNPSANSVSAFSVNTATGALTPVPGSPFATTVAGAAQASPAGLAFDATHTYLYAGRGYNGTGSPGIDGFSIGVNGALTPLAGTPFVVGAGENGFTLLNDPTNNTIISTSNSLDISVYQVGAGGALTPIAGSPFTGRGSNIHSLDKPMPRAELGTGDAGFTQVRGFQILPGGAISGPAPTSTGAGPVFGVRFNPAGTRLYGASSSPSVFGFNVTPGPIFTPIAGSPVTAGGATYNTIFSATGAQLFASGAGNLTSFLVGGSGLATPVQSVTYTTGGGCAAGLAFVPLSADLSVVKTDSPDPVVAGGNITYTVTVTNNGPNATGVTNINDNLDPNTTFVSITAPAGSSCTTPAVGATGSINCTGPGLASGGTAVFTIVAKVNPSAPAMVFNTGNVSSDLFDPNVGNNSSTATTAVVNQADLSVVKTDSPDPVVAGNNITYTIVVTNNGPNAATNVALNDTVPTNTTFVSLATPAGFTSTTPAVGGTGLVASTAPTLASGATATFTLVVKVNPGTANGSSIANTANVSSATTDPNTLNNSSTATTAVVVQSDISIVKTDSPDPVTSGSNVTYTITVTNGGPSNATGVTVTDTLPASVTFVSATTSAGGVVGGAGNARTFTFATIPAGGTATATIVATANCSLANGATITNTATVTSTTTDTNPANNTSTATTTVNNPAPVITCPANITTVGNTPTGRTVTYTTPVATDNCPGATVVCSPASGTFFLNGTTTVTCTATDSGGRTGTCTFTITVNRPPFNLCAVDDVTGDSFRAVTTAGASFGYYEYRKANGPGCADDTIYFGFANQVSQTSIGINLNDTDDPTHSLYASFSPRTGAARVKLNVFSTGEKLVITDVNYFNSVCPCP